MHEFASIFKVCINVKALLKTCIYGVALTYIDWHVPVNVGEFAKFCILNLKVKSKGLGFNNSESALFYWFIEMLVQQLATYSVDHTTQAADLNFFLCFSHGGKGEKPVDLVLSCVDNFEARMAINTVRTPFCCLFFFLFQRNLSGEARLFIITIIIIFFLGGGGKGQGFIDRQNEATESTLILKG